MPVVRTKDGVDIFAYDWGSGPPVVLIHGWPLNADMWEHQGHHLAANGFRVIAYDRRGFGRSGKPWTGHDYDTFADDLAALMEAMDLRGAALVGFSMGGGEVARYLSRHGAGRVAKAALLGAVPPFLLQTADNPNGAPASVFEGMMAGIAADRPGFFAGFGPGFYGPPKVSDAVLDWTLMMAMQASLKGTLDCVRAFGFTDFRQDMKAFTVPTLVMHGEEDAIVPIGISGKASAAAIPGAVLKIYPGAGHGFTWTHKDQVNADLTAFLKG
jgi:pimeloyl-ACP methyl ester carboxylesterase